MRCFLKICGAPLIILMVVFLLLVMCLTALILLPVEMIGQVSGCFTVDALLMAGRVDKVASKLITFYREL